ncbi:MAG: prepilin-type N-terminal cleavage/methylation domain-containing protein [Candidatus Omnitrophota bacterium]|jgi:prepilin-type N-terminal cleavage/methylation domain-containing protein
MFSRKDKSKKSKLSRGFTLIELLVTVGILAFGLCGLLLTYVNMLILSDLSRDYTMATNALQDKMEDIKKVAFDNLSALDATTFDVDGFTAATAKGRIEVYDTGYTDLKRVRLVVCFTTRRRIMGEDRNFNGELDTGEDTMISNTRLDSPIELVTLIAK